MGLGPAPGCADNPRQIGGLFVGVGVRLGVSVVEGVSVADGVAVGVSESSALLRTSCGWLTIDHTRSGTATAEIMRNNLRTDDFMNLFQYRRIEKAGQLFIP